MYRTQARIVIQDERSTAVANLNATDPAYWQDPEPYFNTQYRILQSRGLARRVVRKLPPPPVPAAEHARPRGVASTADAEPLAQPAPAADARSCRRADETVNELAAIGAFLAGVEIIPVKGTRLVEIAYTSPDAEVRRARRQHAAPASTCSRTSISSSRTRTARSTGSAKSSPSSASKVEAAERAMAEYQEGHNAMSLDDRQNIVIAASELAERSGDEGEDGAAAEGSGLPPARKRQRRQCGRGHAIPLIAQNSTIQEIKQQLAHLNGEKAKMSLRYGPQHPEMEKISNRRSQTQLGAAAGGNGEAPRVDWQRLPRRAGGRTEPERRRSKNRSGRPSI